MADSTPELPARLGLLTAAPDRLLVALTAQAGLDFVVLDAEQTPLDPRRCAEVVALLGGTGTDVLVRVPDLTELTLVSYANTGVDELVLPRVRRVEELATAYRSVRYAPEGTRSRQVSPASRYGTDFSRVPRLSVLVETVDAIERVHEIATCGFIDGAWVGPTDLLDDASRLRPEWVDRLDQLTDEAVGVFRSAGVSVGLPAKDRAGAADALRRGADRCAVYWEKYLCQLLAELAAVRSAGRPALREPLSGPAA